MANSAVAERFMAALQESERAGDPGPVADLFADDAELLNLARTEPARGRDGARAFWADYLKAFGSVRSEFGLVVADGAAAVMEWVSDGTLPNGKPVRYRGVSLIETADGAVRKFRTYYDSAAFVTPTPSTDA